jgi:hypothetical protein
MITVQIDDNNRTLARVVNEHGKQAGYVHMENLAQILLGATAETQGQEAVSRERWVDLLGSHGVAMVKTAQNVQLILARPREFRNSEWPHLDETQGRYIRKRLRIEFPPQLWRLQYNNGFHASSQLFLTPELVTSLESSIPIHRFPYGNVYEHGGICWGAVRAVNRMKDNDPNALIDLFWNSGFNKDLGRSFYIGEKAYNGVYEWAMSELGSRELTPSVGFIMPMPTTERVFANVGALVSNISGG